MKRLIQRPAFLGAILAVAAGLGTFMFLGSQGGTTLSTDVPTSAVVVMAHDVGARTRLTADDLEVVQLPTVAVHPLSYTSVDGVVGRFAADDLVQGQQILPPDISDDVLGGGLAQLVPVGERALSIAISNATAAGGLVSPGDHIDVIAIFTQDVAGKDGTAIVAQNVEVLAISQVVLGDNVDKSREAAASSSPQAVSATVTVAVSMEDAQRISLAESFGDLRVFLRNPDDNSEPVAVPLNLDSVARR